MKARYIARVRFLYIQHIFPVMILSEQSDIIGIHISNLTDKFSNKILKDKFIYAM